MPRLDPHLSSLKAVQKKLAKAKPAKAHPFLYDAFRVAVLAGDATTARRLLDLLYGGLPPTKNVATALSTHAMDVVCQEAGFGDLTRGQPTFVQSFVIDGTLPERVAVIERGIRVRLAWNSYDGDYPETDAWRDLPADDPDRDIDRFRRIQALYHPDMATPASLPDARVRLHELLDDWPPDERGVGMGAELAIACDLELRLNPNGAAPVIARWLEKHGARLQDGNLVDSLLCLPPVAAHMLRGGFRAAIAATDDALATAFAEVFTEVSNLTAGAASGKGANADGAIAKIQKRTVSCEYSQVHLEPAERTAAEAKQVFFQDARDSAQGMSLFPTMVGVATPSETEEVDVEWQAKPAPAGELDLGAAVQAVAFPLEVRGPIVVRSVSSGDDAEPLTVLPGRYDVLALFLPKKGKGSLRRFVLQLTAFPAGSLQAPVCFRLEDGSQPPATIHSAG